METFLVVIWAENSSGKEKIRGAGGLQVVREL